MPTGVYPRTEKHLAILRKEWDKKRGRPLSIETRKKISEQALRSGRNKGKNNPFYGKKHTPETIAKIMAIKNLNPKVAVKRAIERNIQIEPTANWGYFIGVVLGDGWLSTDDGVICVGSTVTEIVDAFRDVCELLELPFRYRVRKCRIRPKNPSGMDIRCSVTSPKLSKFMHKYKKSDYHWRIPEIVTNNRDMLIGFLQGLYDAEGGVYFYQKGMGSIELTSKHKTNLVPIKQCLEKNFGIKSNLYESNVRTYAKLVVQEYTSRLKFRETIGFRLERKRIILESMPKRKRPLYSAQVYSYVIKALKKGIMIKDISTKTGIDRNLIRMWKNGYVPIYLRGQLPYR